jgi:hypothetical protein
MDAVGADDGVGTLARAVLESQLHLVFILGHVNAAMPEAEHIFRDGFPQHVEEMRAVNCVIWLTIHPLTLIAKLLTEEYPAILPAAKLPRHLETYAHLAKPLG